MSIKSKTKYILKYNKAVYRFIRLVYTVLAHPGRMMRKKTFGNENSDIIILIIRPISEDGIQGLMSLFVQAVRWIQYAKEKNYKSFVDYKTYKTQYYDGMNNAWELFFKQPDNLIFEDVYKSQNVILSGVSLRKTVEDTLFGEYVFRDVDSLRRSHNILQNSIKLSDEIEKIVNRENAILHVEECIGVYIRGTDYVKLKPTGEFRQPNIQEVCKKVEEFVERYPGKKVFLVTEDGEYYKTMRLLFPELLSIVSFDSFIYGYDGKEFLSKSGLLEEDKKKRGMDYLVKIILLSRCKYLISSITMGSIAAYCFNGGKYDDKYIFDLGYYS